MGILFLAAIVVAVAVNLAVFSILGAKLVGWLESDASEYDWTIRDEEYKA